MRKYSLNDQWKRSSRLLFQWEPGSIPMIQPRDLRQPGSKWPDQGVLSERLDFAQLRKQCDISQPMRNCANLIHV